MRHPERAVNRPLTVGHDPDDEESGGGESGGCGDGDGCGRR